MARNTSSAFCSRATLSRHDGAVSYDRRAHCLSPSRRQLRNGPRRSHETPIRSWQDPCRGVRTTLAPHVAFGLEIGPHEARHSDDRNHACATAAPLLNHPMLQQGHPMKEGKGANASQGVTHRPAFGGIRGDPTPPAGRMQDGASPHAGRHVTVGDLKSVALIRC
jgi:hypothetical protein